MGAYVDDREWSDIMLGQVKDIVGPLLLPPASLELDRRLARSASSPEWPARPKHSRSAAPLSRLALTPSCAAGLPAGATKEAARGEAIRHWPGMVAYFARVRDGGRAEASLIALAGVLRERNVPR